jgi:hypothetical protein
VDILKNLIGSRVKALKAAESGAKHFGKYIYSKQLLCCGVLPVYIYIYMPSGLLQQCNYQMLKESAVCYIRDAYVRTGLIVGKHVLTVVTCITCPTEVRVWAVSSRTHITFLPNAHYTAACSLASIFICRRTKHCKSYTTKCTTGITLHYLSAHSVTDVQYQKNVCT